MTRELDGLLRQICPRLSAIASYLETQGLDTWAGELREIANTLTAHRRHRSPTRDVPLCDDTQPIGLRDGPQATQETTKAPQGSLPDPTG